MNAFATRGPSKNTTLKEQMDFKDHALYYYGLVLLSVANYPTVSSHIKCTAVLLCSERHFSEKILFYFCGSKNFPHRVDIDVTVKKTPLKREFFLRKHKSAN